MLKGMSVRSSLHIESLRQSRASSAHGRMASAGTATTAVYRHIHEGSYELALGLLRAVHSPRNPCVKMDGSM